MGGLGAIRGGWELEGSVTRAQWRLNTRRLIKPRQTPDGSRGTALVAVALNEARTSRPGLNCNRVALSWVTVAAKSVRVPTSTLTRTVPSRGVTSVTIPLRRFRALVAPGPGTSIGSCSVTASARTATETALTPSGTTARRLPASVAMVASDPDLSVTLPWKAVSSARATPSTAARSRSNRRSRDRHRSVNSVPPPPLPPRCVWTRVPNAASSSPRRPCARE